MHPLLWIAIALAAVIALSVRWVPRGHCLVVLRRGQVRRVTDPGLTWVDPLRDHVHLFALDPQDLRLVVRSVTADGHEVVLVARLWFTISDPGLAARTVVAADVTTARLAEELTAAFVADRPLDQISPIAPSELVRLLAAINLRSSLWGTRVEGVDVDEVDVRLVTT